MPVTLTNLRDILLPALRMSPEERAASKQRADRIMATEAAAEQARYNALSDREKADYDALTEGMMPRLRKRNQ